MRFPVENFVISYVDRKQGLCLPAEPSEELAELIGILAGDGHIGKPGPGKDHCISIALNSLDEQEYAVHVKSLFVQTFGLQFTTYAHPHEHLLNIHRKSLGIINYLAAIGYVKQNCLVTVPPWIFTSDNYASRFIRGVFDTDGCIALKRNHGRHEFYPVACIKSKDRCMIFRIAKWLFLKGIPLHVAKRRTLDPRTQTFASTTQLQVNGYTNVGRYMHIIGTSNKKNQNKWEWCDLNTRLHRLQRCALPG